MFAVVFRLLYTTLANSEPTWTKRQLKCWFTLLWALDSTRATACFTAFPRMNLKDSKEFKMPLQDLYPASRAASIWPLFYESYTGYCWPAHCYSPSRNLRSTAKGPLLKPPSLKAIKTATYGDRSFSATAPKLWNKLPPNICAIKSLECFKSLLKTYHIELTF